MFPPRIQSRGHRLKILSVSESFSFDLLLILPQGPRVGGYVRLRNHGDCRFVTLRRVTVGHGTHSRGSSRLENVVGRFGARSRGGGGR